MSRLYEALVAAGSDRKLAREAAEEVAGFYKRLEKVKSGFVLLEWMMGVNIALTFMILWRVFAT